MGDSVVRACFANSAIATQALPAFELLKWAVHSNVEDIKVFERHQKPAHPIFAFDNVLDDKVVARSCEDRNTTVKALEELLTQTAPSKLSAVDPRLRENSGRDEVVN